MSLRDHIAALAGRRATTPVLEADDPETPDDEDMDDTEEDDEMADDPKTDTENKPAVAAVPSAPEAAADPAEIAEHCAANGCAGLAAGLIREKATMDEVRAKVDAAGTIRQMVAAASRSHPEMKADLGKMGDEIVAAGLSVDAARTKLFDAVVAAQAPEIRSAVSPDATAADANRAGWAKAVAKVNGKKAA